MKKKVLLILVDGMRPDGVAQCGDPEMMEFFKAGEHSLNATTVFPPITLPVHVSLFYSVDPCRHHTMTNEFVKLDHETPGLIETLAAAKKTTAMCYTWGELRDVCRASVCGLTYSWFENQETQMQDNLGILAPLDHRATKAAIDLVKEHEPDFIFLYLGAPDEIGHAFGWMSDEYLAHLKNAYSCIKEILPELPKCYNVIVTADHGGHGKDHGERVPADMTIPITFHGPCFTPSREIESLNIKDLAPTIADILGVAAPRVWEGISRVSVRD